MEEKNKNELVFTPYIKLKDGRIIYASTYGKKVFCFPKTKVDDHKDN